MGLGGGKGDFGFLLLAFVCVGGGGVASRVSWLVVDGWMDGLVGKKFNGGPIIMYKEQIAVEKFHINAMSWHLSWFRSSRETLCHIYQSLATLPIQSLHVGW